MEPSRAPKVRIGDLLVSKGLIVEEQLKRSKESVEELRQNWDFWLDLPNTPSKYIRVDNLEEGIGAVRLGGLGLVVGALLADPGLLELAHGDGASLVHEGDLPAAPLPVVARRRRDANFASVSTRCGGR